MNSKPFTLIGVDEIDSLRRVKLIGRGNNSRVYMVSRDFALKELDNFCEENRDTTELFEKSRALLRDIEMMNIVDHPNVLKGFGICIGDKHHFPSILLEFCPNHLSDIVCEMDSIQRVTTIFETCARMKAVHESNLIHRNLKPENILISKDGHVRVSDFAKSRLEETDFIGMNFSKTGIAGDMRFMAPELLNGNTHYDEKVDVYSFGVIVFFILTGGRVPNVNMGDILKGKRVTIPKEINDFSCELIRICMSPDTKERPSFENIYKMIISNQFKMINGVEKEIKKINDFLFL